MTLSSELGNSALETALATVKQSWKPGYRVTVEFRRTSGDRASSRRVLRVLRGVNGFYVRTGNLPSHKRYLDSMADGRVDQEQGEVVFYESTQRAS